jgi:hypothetical protein
MPLSKDQCCEMAVAWFFPGRCASRFGKMIVETGIMLKAKSRAREFKNEP